MSTFLKMKVNHFCKLILFSYDLLDQRPVTKHLFSSMPNPPQLRKGCKCLKNLAQVLKGLPA